MRPAAVVGDLLLCPACPIPPFIPQGFITTGSLTTFINGRPVARVGDFGVCGLPVTLVTGSFTIFIEGRPVHRAGDLNSCGGPTLTPTNLTVYAGD
jgi:uncharacterized Zn-binding protein involved in type VI secretion